MKLFAILTALALLATTAVAQTAGGTFTETYPVTTTTTVNGTVSCTLSSTSTVLTCTFSQAVQPNATITISIPSGL